MGLPNKKQLHKHKRGTRKAMDTLEAMDKAENSIEMEAGDVEDLVAKKKSKTSRSKTKATSKVKKKPPKAQGSKKTEQADHPPAIDNQGNESEDQIVPGIAMDEPTLSAQTETNTADDSKYSSDIKSNKEKIDFSDETSVIESEIKKEDIGNQKEGKDPVSEEEAKELRIKSDAEKEKITDSKLQDEDFEDTLKDKYLTFQIADESFGVAIRHVTEIIVIHSITEVPDTAAFVKGVINLRGKVIPVIDVRHRFDIEHRDYNDRTCIIVVDCLETAVGMIVDTVNEVVDIPENQIDPPPRSHCGIESSYIEGMGKIGNQVNIILNIEKVLFIEEILVKKRDLEE